MRKKDFDNLVGSIRQAGKIRRGEREARRSFQFDPADIKGIRQRQKKSQSEFTLMTGVNVSTLRNSEQGRGRSGGPARAFLRIAAERPDAVVEALSS